VRFQKLDLNLLVVLDLLLEEKSITKTAKKLHLSQSATSSILGRLREYFDDELLVSVGRNMVPTALAMSLQQPVRQLVLQIQATLAVRARFLPAECDRHFHLIASDYTTSIVLPRLVQRLRREAPNVTIEVSPPSLSAADCMRRGEADFLLVPDVFKLEDFPEELLLEDTYSCVVWAGNPLIGEAITREQYLQMGHVSVAFTGRAQSFENMIFEHAQITRRVEIIATSFTAQPQLLLGTDRIATMHTRLANYLARYFPIRCLPLPIEMPKMKMVAQWNMYQEKDPAHQWLRSVLKEVARDSCAMADGRACSEIVT
jgi:LysR family nod box-dependent transcriptional activator